jgi:mono/diheme cytochrome c family protein
MPVVARNCAVCHAKGGSPPQLDGAAGPGGEADAPAARAYAALLAPGEAGREAAPRWKYVEPGRARTSPLVWHLLGRNTSRPWDGAAARAAAKPIPPGKAEPLSAEEKRLFVTWIDLGASWSAGPGGDGRP